MSDESKPKKTVARAATERRNEIFVKEIIRGKHKHVAYKIAHSDQKDMSDSKMKQAAHNLFATEPVQKLYNKILNEQRKKEREVIVWERTDSIKELIWIINKNKEEIKNMISAHEDIEDYLERLYERTGKDEDQLNLFKHRWKSRFKISNNTVIIDSINCLNKMQGFNEQTLNVKGAVVFEGEDELED